MTAYRQGDVVLVPFPFTDLQAEKRRPAVIISANWYNTIKPDVIAAAATSSILSQAVLRLWRSTKRSTARHTPISGSGGFAAVTYASHILLRQVNKLPRSASYGCAATKRTNLQAKFQSAGLQMTGAAPRHPAAV